jgi:hypothetical protein
MPKGACEISAQIRRGHKLRGASTRNRSMTFSSILLCPFLEGRFLDGRSQRRLHKVVLRSRSRALPVIADNYKTVSAFVASIITVKWQLAKILRHPNIPRLNFREIVNMAIFLQHLECRRIGFDCINTCPWESLRKTEVTKTRYSHRRPRKSLPGENHWNKKSISGLS